MAEYDKSQLRKEYLPTGQPTGRFEEVEDIQTVALGKDQIRKTTRVETNEGFHTTVEILEPDPGAGMSSTGLRTVRKEVVARGKRA